MAESVILVDSDDNVIGNMEKLEAHKKALLHRAVSVFIFNTKGQLLLQKRSLDKYHSPGLWTNTACTHPRPDENAENAANRRLHEEMGIKMVTLTKLFHFVYKEPLDNDLTEHEFDHVFIGISDALPILNPAEVCDFAYVDTTDLLAQIGANPENYTVWFKQIIEQVLASYVAVYQTAEEQA